MAKQQTEPPKGFEVTSPCVLGPNETHRRLAAVKEVVLPINCMFSAVLNINQIYFLLQASSSCLSCLSMKNLYTFASEAEGGKTPQTFLFLGAAS